MPESAAEQVDCRNRGHGRRHCACRPHAFAGGESGGKSEGPCRRHQCEHNFAHGKTVDAGAEPDTTSLVVESAAKNLIVGSRKRGTSSNFQSRPRTSPTRATAVKSAAPASVAISVFFICVAIIPFCGDKRRPHCTLPPLLGMPATRTIGRSCPM